MNINIGISPRNMKLCSESLNELLQNEYLLYTKTRIYHWNVEGPQFYGKHKFFEELYKKSDEMIEKIAERIRQLGHFAEIKFDLTSKATVKLNTDSAVMTANLVKDHDAIIRKIRGRLDAIESRFKDAGTAELMTVILKEHEKISWMLRSYLL